MWPRGITVSILDSGSLFKSVQELKLFVGYAQDPLADLGGELACDQHEDTESQSIPPARRPPQMPTILHPYARDPRAMLRLLIDLSTWHMV